MKDFEDYYTDTSIIKLLCKHRAKISHKRHKKHMLRDISCHPKTNNIFDTDPEFQRIQALFPSRRSWKKLNQHERLDPSKLNNSLEQNQMRLWKSFKHEKLQVAQKAKAPEVWYLNLLSFCENIRSKISGISTGGYNIARPQIIPLPKSNEIGDIVYRPIAKYNLEDKIITSLLSRYLTVIYDEVFLDCSFAFRAKKDGFVPSHHDSIVAILKHRKKFKRLWVAECDIQKFFDIVQHDHLLNIFDKSIEELRLRNIEVSKNADILFKLFLKSYSFDTDVLPKNSEDKYFRDSGVPVGRFGWVEEELKENFGKDYVEQHKIGVPQGNAISCFIANLLLHEVDKSIKSINQDILYVRYCDDMVLAHKDKNICNRGLEEYKTKVKENFLLYHQPKKIDNYKMNSKFFWEAKSKEPFFWGNKHCGEENVPWLSFVGYQINYKGEIRIRKISIEKEIRKQISEIQRVLISLGLEKGQLKDINKFSRKTQHQLLFSLQQRLISMSVGRMTIYNFENKKLDKGLCWSNGFKELRKNEIALKQLKLLDRSREQQIHYFRRVISELEKKGGKPDELPEYMEDLYFGLPYSYYNNLDN